MQPYGGRPDGSPLQGSEISPVGGTGSNGRGAVSPYPFLPPSSPYGEEGGLRRTGIGRWRILRPNHTTGNNRGITIQRTRIE